MRDTYMSCQAWAEVLQGCRDSATRMSPDAERPKAKVRHQLEAQQTMKTVGDEDEVT